MIFVLTVIIRMHLTERQNMCRYQTRDALSAMMFMVRIMRDCFLIQLLMFAVNVTILKSPGLSKATQVISLKEIPVSPVIRLILLQTRNFFENSRTGHLTGTSAIPATTPLNQSAL